MGLIAINGKIGSGKDTIGKIIQYLICLNKKTLAPHQQDFKDFGRSPISNGIQSGYKIKKFADTLKDMVCILIGCTREQLEDLVFKNTELPEEWWYWYMRLEGGYGEVMLDYLTTSKKTLKMYEGLVLVKPTPRSILQLMGTECGRQIIHPNIWVNALFSEYKPINSNILRSNSYEDNRLKHGYNKTRIFRIYHNIKQRCYNNKHPRYEDYGKRGIIMDDYWKNSFENFLKWSEVNGYSDTLTLDRKDNNLGYSPENCRWVTYSTQATNTKVRKDNTSGFRGVSYDKKNGNRIRANIQINGKIKFLGYFDTLEEASETYELAYIERENLYEKLEPIPELIYPNFIITDMRFPNELEAVKKRGGITIKVIRGSMSMAELANQHESETALDNYDCKYTIYNHGTIEDLIENVRQVLIEEKII